MHETAQLGLPLVQASQAQKHVTVNEALMRLDGLVQLTLQSNSQTMPPLAVLNGACYGVPAGAVNEWSGQDGNVAIGSNSGWVFAAPARGWRAYIADVGQSAIHDGSVWRGGQITLSPHNAGLSASVAEIDHDVISGPVSTTVAIIPSNAMVIGVTARVIREITGTLSSWELGNPGAAGRFGSGLGLAAGSYARGLLGQPTAFYSPTAMQLDASGGDFADGAVRIAVHYLTLGLPDL
ncbi:DUF2793 domain-containing protein [Defluviimonas sp. WL0002]|uniref:DUF2793 domain-containing protein n=1 Tax=Albidovulum marisflavi TaxID=2984159 RepID=A0ABT2ZBN0_9RHOB|nr:DUF2793 domain-containing protein [Defluviimonas sp. WL0002]MCV2868542.1 DUF2793 domain-containing protein [Defluviimonas sp. WL0002]